MPLFFIFSSSFTASLLVLHSNFPTKTHGIPLEVNFPFPMLCSINLSSTSSELPDFYLSTALLYIIYTYHFLLLMAHVDPPAPWRDAFPGYSPKRFLSVFVNHYE